MKGKFPASVWVAIIAFALMCGFDLLLPIERGFPGLSLGGVTIMFPIVISYACLGLMLVIDFQGIKSLMKGTFFTMQVMFVCSLLIAALLRSQPAKVVYIPVIYSSVFICNYLICCYLLSKGLKTFVVWTIISCSFLASLVGIYNLVLGDQIPFYMFFEIESKLVNGAELGGSFRANGTLGNSLVYSSALMGCIPFFFDVKSKPIRWIGTACLVLGAAATVSRTIVIPAFFFIILGLAQLPKKGWKVLGLAVILGVIGITTIGGSVGQGSKGSFLDVWAARIEGGEESKSNIVIRQKLGEYAMASFEEQSDPRGILLGRGLRAGADLGAEIGIGADTLDNAFLTIGYECGILGFLVFVIGFVICFADWWKAKSMRLHYLNILAWFVSGVSFVTIYYVSLNFAIVCSIAFIDYLRRTEKSNHESLQAA